MDKKDDMKVIYLDQNIWSKLTRAIFIPSYQNNKYHSIVNKICKKVKQKKWIFPIGMSHFIETRQWIRNDQMRKNLTAVQNFFSDGAYIANFSEVFIDEIRILSENKPFLSHYITMSPLGFDGQEKHMEIYNTSDERDLALEEIFNEFLGSMIYPFAVESANFLSNTEHQETKLNLLVIWKEKRNSI